MPTRIWDKQQYLTPVLNSAFDEVAPRLSPDGHSRAYVSNESGRGEVYVVPFPGRGGRWQISNNGAAASGMLVSGITWSRDGKQLYFRDAAQGLMVADVQLQGSGFHSGITRPIFSAPAGVRPLGTAPDGRIRGLVQPDEAMAPPIRLT